MKKYVIALLALSGPLLVNAAFFGSSSRSSDTPGSFSGAVKDRWQATKDRFGFGQREIEISEPTGFRRVGESHPTLPPRKPGMAERARGLYERAKERASGPSSRPSGNLADYLRNHPEHRKMISIRDKDKAKIRHLARDRKSSFYWYEILNVRPDADPRAVERAYTSNRNDSTAKAYNHWLKKIFDPGRKKRLW